MGTAGRSPVRLGVRVLLPGQAGGSIAVVNGHAIDHGTCVLWAISSAIRSSR